MKSKIAAIVVAAPLVLGGCTTLGGPGTTSVSLVDIANQVIAAVQFGCRLEPSLASVLNLLQKYTKVSSAGLISQVADDVCKFAPPPTPATMSGAADPTSRKKIAFKVRGVTIRALR